MSNTRKASSFDQFWDNYLQPNDEFDPYICDLFGKVFTELDEFSTVPAMMSLDETTLYCELDSSESDKILSKNIENFFYEEIERQTGEKTFKGVRIYDQVVSIDIYFNCVLQSIQWIPVLQSFCKRQNIRDYYSFGEVINSSVYGQVYKAIKAENKQLYSITQIQKSKKNFCDKQIDGLIKLLRKSQHPGIARLYEVFEDTQEIFLVRELVPGGNLQEYIVENGAISENEAASAFWKLLELVQYLHRKNIAHLDIKPETLLLANRKDLTSIKICDCAFPQPMSNPHPVGPSEEFDHTAKEVRIDVDSFRKSDIFSCGMLLCSMLIGLHPVISFEDPSQMEDVERSSVCIQEMNQAGCSENAIEIVKNMIDPVPMNRSSTSELLSFPWIIDQLISSVSSEEQPSTAASFSADTPQKQGETLSFSSTAAAKNSISLALMIPHSLLL